MVMPVIMDEAEDRLALMAEEWQAVLASSVADQAVLMDWEQSIDLMRREADSLRDQGRWRGGYRTLMHALGLQHREVYLTAGLAWLLDPDGWHGLGSKVLSGLLGQLGLPPAINYPVRVAVEESRSGGETRADLVVRMPGVTLLIESKVYADEQPGQCDRLAAAWAPEQPTLVFLTLDGRPPRTADRSAALWQCLAWAQVAVIIADAARVSDCAPGVQDLLATIEIFGK
jgi:PD-(D/E)XK nuclease superfamily